MPPAAAHRPPRTDRRTRAQTRELLVRRRTGLLTKFSFDATGFDMLPRAGAVRSGKTGG